MRRVIRLYVFAGVLTLYREQDIAYGLTLVWSLAAVYAKQGHLDAMRVVSSIGMVLLVVATALSILRLQRQRKYVLLNGGGLGDSLQT